MDARRKGSLAVTIPLLIATVVWLASTRFGQPDPAIAGRLIGTRSNLDITLKDDTGQNVNLASFHRSGKTVIFNYFATWCAPCLAEIPDLIELQKDRPDVVVVGLLVTDPAGQPLPAFRKRFGINYPLVDANDSLETEAALSSPEFLPVSVIVDPAGTITAILNGRSTRAQFEAELPVAK
jgi:thiol-disulfide isomerase/thioredoxin